jgi:hypothetical protein
MTKLTGAALDRAVAHAMGLKSVHNCEKWSGAMDDKDDDDDIQDYKKPWVGLTDQESIDIIKKDDNYKYPIKLLQAVMDALKAKNT